MANKDYWLATFLTFYWIARGVLEGWHWADKQNKHSNVLIKNRLWSRGRAKLDYHTWRAIETIVVNIIIMMLLGWTWINFFFILGLNFIAAAFYEWCLNYVSTGKLSQNKTYEIMWLKVTWGPIKDWILFVAGCIIEAVVILVSYENIG